MKVIITLLALILFGALEHVSFEQNPLYWGIHGDHFEIGGMK